jgi:hypothetical protein
MGRRLHAGKWNSRAWQHGARRDLAGSLLAGGVGQAVLVVSGVLVARALGPEDRGYMALVLLVPSLLALVGSLGLPLASTYFVARSPESARSIATKLIVPAALQTAIGVLLTLGALLTVLSDEPARVVSAGLVATALVPALLAQTYGLALLQDALLSRMRLLAADDNLRSAMGEAAFDRARGQTGERWAEAFEAAVDALLRRPR